MAYQSKKISIETAENMLNFTDPDEYHYWVSILMALYDEFGDSARDIAEHWSSQNCKFNQKEFNQKWRSMKSGSTTIGTLIFHAVNAGFEFDKDAPVMSAADIAIRKAERLKRTEQARLEESELRQKNLISMNKIKEKSLLFGEPMRKYMINRGTEFKNYECTRFIEKLDFWEGNKFIKSTPGLVSVITNVGGDCIGMHKIFITENGFKAFGNNSKKRHGRTHKSKGGSIKLTPKGKEMCFTEGLEGAWAIEQGSKLCTWCCVDAGGLERVQVPDILERANIMADKDFSGQGERSANILAERLMKQGVEVHILLPDQPIPAGSKSIDWLDVYNMEKAK